MTIIHPNEKAAILGAMATDPPPPYLVTDPTEPHAKPTLWTLQRGSTAEGVEPAYVWLVYVASDGRSMSGERTLKFPPPVTTPLEVQADDWDGGL